MFRNFIMLMFACVILSACASEPVRLYEGEPLSAEQVSIISSGLTDESEPGIGIGSFFPAKIDDSNKCLLYREKSACEILPGTHTLQVNYIWYSYEAAVAGAIAGGFALCFMTAGLICGELPPDMGCQSILEFNSQGGHTYLLKLSEASDNSDKFNVVLEDTKSGQLIANEPCILIEKPQSQQPKGTMF